MQNRPKRTHKIAHAYARITQTHTHTLTCSYTIRTHIHSLAHIHTHSHMHLLAHIQYAHTRTHSHAHFNTLHVCFSYYYFLIQPQSRIEREEEGRAGTSASGFELIQAKLDSLIIPLATDESTESTSSTETTQSTSAQVVSVALKEEGLQPMEDELAKMLKETESDDETVSVKTDLTSIQNVCEMNPIIFCLDACLFLY